MSFRSPLIDWPALTRHDQRVFVRATIQAAEPHRWMTTRRGGRPSTEGGWGTGLVGSSSGRASRTLRRSPPYGRVCRPSCYPMHWPRRLPRNQTRQRCAGWRVGWLNGLNRGAGRSGPPDRHRTPDQHGLQLRLRASVGSTNVASLRAREGACTLMKLRRTWLDFATYNGVGRRFPFVWPFSGLDSAAAPPGFAPRPLENL